MTDKFDESAQLSKRNLDYLRSLTKEKKLQTLSETLNMVIDFYRHHELIETLRSMQ